MKKGEVAGPILASPVIGGQGASLQIIKLNTTNGDTVTASHIVINLQDPGVYIKQLKLQKPPHPYVHF
jgi:hypothetical protein